MGSERIGGEEEATESDNSFFSQLLLVPTDDARAKRECEKGSEARCVQGKDGSGASTS